MASTMISLASATPSASLSVQETLKGKMRLGSGSVSTLFNKEKGNPSIKKKSFGRISMTVAVNVSRFEGIAMAPPDPILGVSEAFRADIDVKKLNLGVGAYRTEELQPYVLDVVKKAENLMLERGENKEYLAIEGLAAFNKVTAELLFGADNQVIEQQRVATVQGLSGTGSLRLAAALIERYFPGAQVLISSPTWGNHKNIFNDARVPWSEYRYYDPKTVGLDFEGMISDIKAAPEGSFVLLHGCAHNPTGIDPTPEQWEKIADVIQEKNHIPFFDVAYQGFASGSLDADASSVRLFAARGMELLVAQSYSKNLGLYAERIGAINVVCSSADAAARVKSQLKRIARPMYSNPPVHGARIVANVVGDPALFNEWKAEMEMMAGRIKNVRQKLFDSLSAKDKSGKDWSFILKQIGMFSFTGLNKAQSDNMTNKWHVYMTKDGRISLAGLSLAKCEYLADAIIDSWRFLSGDLDYIKSAIFSLIESVKFEKKHIIKDVLRLVDAYRLNHTEVLLRYLSSILVSEVWTDDDDVKAEISEVKGEIISFGSETIKTISLVVYPTIDGCNKQRLACIYGLLSDCYLRLGESKKSSSTAHPNSPNLSALDVARLYKVFEQECQRVSFIKNLDFKNVAGLDGLNLQSFKNEVFSHVNESSLEALAKMVQTLASIYADSLPEGLIVWQDVYKHYTMSLLTTLESRVRKECDVQNAERFQGFMSQLEQTYDFCRTYMRLLSPSDSLDIMKRYFTVIIPLHSSHEIIPDNSTWQDCVIVLLNFWLKLTEEMQEIALDESSVGTLRFDPEFLSSCLKVFMRMVMEDSVSPSQAWGTVIGYASSGLIGDFSVEIPIFCRAMLYSGCGFGAISEVFLESMSICAISSASTAKNESLDLPHLYVNMLELILRNLVGGSHEHQNLYHLLSSLSKLEGQMENLQRVRHVVWERMAQFSDNLELPSHVRVYVLEIMQFITGRSIKGFSTELNSNLLPWEGWDGLLSTGKKSNPSANQGSPDHTDNSSRFTSTLVALRSSQLASAISPSIAITPDDLLNAETAVSCFLKLCESSSTEPHFDALIAILEEWEGFFVTAKDEVDTTEATETGNDWNNDDWDEGWESFQEVEALEKEKPENSNHVHPLHVCWMEIFKKLITLSKFKDVLRLIDCSLSKSYGVLLDEDDARSLSQTVLEKDSFMALKMVLLLPYEAIQLQCLNVVEDKLKQGGISGVLGRDHEVLMLVLSSGVISNIITKPSYGTTFSYLCYVVGNFSRQSQEAQLSTITNKGANERVNIEKDVLLLFIRIMFPCFISELVKTDQQILAGFLITKFMHTNPSFSLINTTESSLSRYLERQLHALQQGDYFSLEEISSCEMFRNTVSRLTIKLGDEIRSALPLLSSNAR